MTSASATSTADAAGEPVGTTKYGWRVVLFSGAGWFFDGYVINVWPLAIPFVMTDLHLTVENIGTITTVYVTAYMLGTLFGGTFADYLGRRSVLSFSVLFYMFLDALTAVAQGFWSLAFFRFMTGTGTGMELPVGSTFITEAVNDKWRARLLALMNIGYPARICVGDWGVCDNRRSMGLERGFRRLYHSRHRRLLRQAQGIRVASLSDGGRTARARRSKTRPRGEYYRVQKAICPGCSAGRALLDRQCIRVLGVLYVYPALPSEGPPNADIG